MPDAKLGLKNRDDNLMFTDLQENGHPEMIPGGHHFVVNERLKLRYQ
jgi:hypothetical protein